MINIEIVLPNMTEVWISNKVDRVIEHSYQATSHMAIVFIQNIRLFFYETVLQKCKLKKEYM